MGLSVWTGHFIETLTLFVLVVIHEMGHITAACLYGWKVHKLELLPFGGLAQMEEWGLAPSREEIVVALAGPCQHIFAIVLGICLWELDFWTQDWTQYFVIANLWLAWFNLLPIYPLDGGRILQSILSLVLPYRLAIILTALLGVSLAVLLVGCAFLIPGSTVHIPLLCIALFLLFYSGYTLSNYHVPFLRFLLHRWHSKADSSERISRIKTSYHQPLRLVVRKFYKGRYHLIEILDSGGKMLGIVPEELVLSTYLQQQYDCRVGELLRMS
jgi:stage IV sporulation protein FB